MKNDWNYAYTKILVYMSEHSGDDPIVIMVWTQSKYMISECNNWCAVIQNKIW